ADGCTIWWVGNNRGWSHDLNRLDWTEIVRLLRPYCAINGHDSAVSYSEVNLLALADGRQSLFLWFWLGTPTEVVRARLNDHSEIPPFLNLCEWYSAFVNGRIQHRVSRRLRSEEPDYCFGFVCRLRFLGEETGCSGETHEGIE